MIELFFFSQLSLFLYSTSHAHAHPDSEITITGLREQYAPLHTIEFELRSNAGNLWATISVEKKTNNKWQEIWADIFQHHPSKTNTTILISKKKKKIIWQPDNIPTLKPKPHTQPIITSGEYRFQIHWGLSPSNLTTTTHSIPFSIITQESPQFVVCRKAALILF